MVRQVIQEANVAASMQRVSKKYNLHLDQWQDLEYEVTMALYGVTEMEALEINIIKHVGIEPALARNLSNDIALAVFQPIREELERRLEHPDATPKQGTPMEDLTAEILRGDVPEPTPATSPKTVEAMGAPQVRTEVTPSTLSTSYTPGQASTERKHIDNDPYREPIA